MYDDKMFEERTGYKNGEPYSVFIPEPDAYFPQSLELYDEIISADIVAEDTEGAYGRTRPNEYEIRVPELGYAVIHAPYNMELTGGGYMTLHNPPRFLRVRLKNGNEHYFPFSGINGSDVKGEYEEEWLDLFDDKYEDIKILIEAARPLIMMEGIDEDIDELDDDTERIESFHIHLEVNYPKARIADYFNDDDEEDMDDPIQEDAVAFEKDGENRLDAFLNAVKRAGDINLKPYEARLDEFLRFSNDDGSDYGHEGLPFG